MRSLGSLLVGLGFVSDCAHWRGSMTRGPGGRRTAVVFDTHVYARVDQVGGYVDGLFAVD